mmetsp:Transcript_106908/g.297718  ORF Transcript_106908/g.297718 Transcript_106908/m.297718 type:complete len:270 (-) Transcript_106908:407-1216(-)
MRTWHERHPGPVPRCPLDAGQLLQMRSTDSWTPEKRIMPSRSLGWRRRRAQRGGLCRLSVASRRLPSQSSCGNGLVPGMHLWTWCFVLRPSKIMQSPLSSWTVTCWFPGHAELRQERPAQKTNTKEPAGSLSRCAFLPLPPLYTSTFRLKYPRSGAVTRRTRRKSVRSCSSMRSAKVFKLSADTGDLPSGAPGALQDSHLSLAPGVGTDRPLRVKSFRILSLISAPRLPSAFLTTKTGSSLVPWLSMRKRPLPPRLLDRERALVEEGSS